MDTVLAARVCPRPLTQARVVADPDDRGRGFLLIAVAASVSGPHAVAGAGGTLTYPRRSGPTTVNLSEEEVAQAYRRRFGSAAGPSRRDAGGASAMLCAWSTCPECRDRRWTG
ncbi:hypothetical protein CC117_22500 [Parafrankia colletiae]|uniref:Uncharacterized protein n=1 Tax=Parafrankia colletiae TaxID=573497 RepID=A0A1S1QIL1_9ACTN|nr:hypothetical protein [Parafrankia colletiae]MCK9901521.1 hypothetical protein [Frankia sp. Cpl3]OHV33446.1 hypothetical protein CC117_22500 [Parafrankia colletiae]